MNRPLNTHTREQRNQEFFDNWAEKYDSFRISRWFRYTQQLALNQFNWASDGKLLDVGCGTGSAVLCAASMLPLGRACGIDITSAMIARAREKTPSELAERVEFREAGAEHIPYGDNAFDYVMCTNSFHHYHEPMRALREMRRVLKPGGSLVIFENAPDLSIYTWFWDRLLRVIEKGHVRYYPSSELGTMINEAEYTDVELRVLKNEVLKFGKLFASIQIWAARKPAIVAEIKKAKEVR